MIHPHRILIPFALAAFATSACTTETEPSATDTTTDVSTTDTAPDATPIDAAPQTDVAADVDTTDADRGEGLCLGVIGQCIAQCESTACFDTCLTTNASSEAEATLANAYITCMVDGECVPPTETTTENVRLGYNCEQTKCLPERAACEQGVAGTDDCVPIGGCLADCTRDDFRCYRGCLGAATEADATTFIKLQYCVSANCYEKNGTQADFDLCAQMAIAEDGPCVTLRTDCYGDTPGLEAMGFEPMYGSFPPNPWP